MMELDFPFYYLIANADSGGVFTYFNNANLAGKFILFTLFALSLTAWTVMLGKFWDLWRLHSTNRNFEASLKSSDPIVQMSLRSWQQGRSTYAQLVTAALQGYHSVSKGKPCAKDKMRFVENALERTVAEVTLQYESKMVALGSIISGAPFLGLLGTVWGVMDAFGNIALQNNAHIQTLAPGVSGALLTTVAGLLVAIPSVFGYNALLSQTKQMTTELENFASSLADRIEREFSV